MEYSVYLTEDAASDLNDIYDYLTHQENLLTANHVLDQFEKRFLSLAHNPNRGKYPKELVSLGIKEFREIFFKPYHIIYRVIGKNVYVMLIADGRRDMHTLLQRRLLGT
jgi:toxin ParE1/3/4